MPRDITVELAHQFHKLVFGGEWPKLWLCPGYHANYVYAQTSRSRAVWIYDNERIESTYCGADFVDDANCTEITTEMLEEVFLDK